MLKCIDNLLEKRRNDDSAEKITDKISPKKAESIAPWL